MNKSIPEPLRDRFAQWAAASAGEQYRRNGYSSLDRIGDPPANDPVGDPSSSDLPDSVQQLERIVQAMEHCGRWKEARVLRAEHFMASLPEPVRLARLKRIGLSISRTSYYVYLDAAYAFVAGALSTDVPSEDADRTESASV